MPDLSPVILSSNSLDAAWRFILSYHQLSLLERAQSIQFSSAFNYLCASQDSRRLIQFLNLTIQQESNARINRAGINHIVRQVDDEKQANSAPVE